MIYEKHRRFNEWYVFILFIFSIAFLIYLLRYTKFNSVNQEEFNSAISYFKIPVLLFAIYFILLYFLTKFALHLIFKIYLIITALLILDSPTKVHHCIYICFIFILAIYFLKYFESIKNDALMIKKSIKLFYRFFMYNYLNIVFWELINCFFLYCIFMQENLSDIKKFFLLFEFYLISFLISYCINIYNSTLLWFYNINDTIKIREAYKNVLYALGTSIVFGFVYLVQLVSIFLYCTSIFNFRYGLFTHSFYMYRGNFEKNLFFKYFCGWSYIYIAIKGMNCIDVIKKLIDDIEKNKFLCEEFNLCITYAYICFAISIYTYFANVYSLSQFELYALIFGIVFCFPFISIINGFYKIHHIYENIIY